MYYYKISLRDIPVYPLGLSIVGGRETPMGQHGAYITKVKKGSIADTVGHLRPGTVLSYSLLLADYTCKSGLAISVRFFFQFTVQSAWVTVKY